MRASLAANACFRFFDRTDDDLTYEQLRNTVMQAAEIWNAETSAMKLVFAGPAYSHDPLSWPAEEGTRHLLSWDKDCSDLYNPGAELSYRVRGYSSTGAIKDWELDSRTSSRDGRTFGFNYTTSGTPRHSFYYHDAVMSSAANSTSGWFSFYDYYMNAAHLTDLYELDVAPELFRAQEFTPGSWSFVESVTAGDAVGAPSFGYRDGYAGVLTWGESR